MKSMVTILVVAAGLALAGGANASEDLAKKDGCMTCHAMDAKKMGPSFKDLAAKLKGKDEAAVVADLMAAKGHPKVKSSEADTVTLVKWIKSL
jgi:cytochrome c